MPQSISRTGGATAPTTSPSIPARFDAADLKKIWNGGTAISIGASGMGVQQIQSALNDVGYPVGTADGAFGPKTEGALKGFQKSQNLPQTGKIDKATINALGIKLGGPSPKPTGGALTNNRFVGNAQLQQVLKAGAVLGAGTKGEGLKAVQQSLIDMGFALYGGADGAYGAQSKKAITNFQKHAQRMFPDVPVTGTLDAATLKALDVLAPKKGEQGQTLNVPSPKYDGKLVRVVVVKSEHRTFLFDKNGKLETIIPNAVGAQMTSTESGLKKVTGKLGEADSAALGQRLWGNPKVFGPRIIDLSWADGSSSGEELHGTSAPQDLGADVSHGCMRHDNKDIITLFNALSVGDRVAVVDRLDDPRLGKPNR
ncbi:MAG: peptidoglycan-binding protein [Myxococcaceae bacterium]